MGVFKETLDAIKELILLKDEIKRLGQTQGRLADHVADLSQRIIRLESREEALLARAEAAATLASSNTRQGELGDIRERLARIEFYLGTIQAQANQPAAMSLAPPNKPDVDGS